MKDYLPVFIVNLLSKLSLESARRVGRFFAFNIRLFKTRSYRVIRRNIELAFPDMTPAEREDLTHRAVLHSGYFLGELGFTFGPRKRLDVKAKNRVVETQVDVIERAMSAGKGVIVIVPHYGNWELFTLTLPQYGDMMVLYKPIEYSDAFEQRVLECRSHNGVGLATADKHGAKKMFRHFRRGGNCFVLPDQVPEENSGIWSTFFGMDALTSNVVYNLLRMNPEGRVVIGLMKRTDRGFQAVYHEPDPEIYSPDKQTCIDAMNRSMERCILAEGAEQYLWAYKRYKGHASRPYKGI